LAPTITSDGSKISREPGSECARSRRDDPMPLRGAISGFGEVAAQAHLAGWGTRPGVSIVAIHDPVAARRHHAINLAKNVRVYDNLELMLDGEALDFVDIASPPAFHAPTARLALEAGANVLVEKPLCVDAAESDELAALAARESRILMCVHNWKHAPAYRRAHEMVASGRLGEVRYVSLMRLRTGAAGAGGSMGASGERWRLDAQTGGGILVDHGWHVFYLMHWLMGGAAPLAVAARLGFSNQSSKVDDLADLRVDFPGGAIGYAHLSWRAPVRRTSATVYGSEGILEIEGERIILTDRSGMATDYSVSDAPDDSYHSAWFARTAEDFVRAVAEGPDGELAGENRAEAKAALAIIIGARESSAADGSRVNLTGNASA
jgi:predicted dehydrogenase